MLSKGQTMKIAIAPPTIGDAEKQAVIDVLESGHLWQGEKTQTFEARFAAYHGAKHGIAVNNGTTALIAALMAHGIGPGDEVIVPAFTFFATAASVLAVGARVVFADIEPDTFCLSPEDVERVMTERTRAIIPVHLYGHPADMPRFADICARHQLALIEDAAQAHGTRIGKQFTGTWGTATFSFHQSKNMMTAEGGMILTNDDEIDRQLRMIRNQGMNTRYYHEVVGYNFRLTDIAAAIGLVQLEHLPEWTTRRIENATYFSERLTTVRPPVTRPDHRHVFHQYTVRIPAGLDRNALTTHLNQSGISADVYYPRPIYQQPVFQQLGGYETIHLPETERATREVFSIPVHPQLTETEREYIVQTINAFV